MHFTETGGREEESAALREQTILIVDDEVDIRESLKELFLGALTNVRVLTAESGASGLEVVRQGGVDLIVTDYKMPGMSGIEFLAEARKTARGIPRILMTAFPDLELAIRAVNDENIENFFTKPLEPGTVVDVVRSILEERRTEEMRNRAFARSLNLLRRQLDTKK